MPANCLLVQAKLAEHAECVLPVENQALADICTAAERSRVPRRGAVAPGGREAAQDCLCFTCCRDCRLHLFQLPCQGFTVADDRTHCHKVVSSPWRDRILHPLPDPPVQPQGRGSSHLTP